MKINGINHKKQIWTWNSKSAGKKSLWLPYLQNAIKHKGSTWIFKFNGGEIKAELEKIDFILFYGASCDIPLKLFDDFNKYRIIAILHRRNIATPYVFYCSDFIDHKSDVLTKQILARENGIKSKFIAKTLIRERLKSMDWLIDVPETHYTRLRASKSLKEIRGIESQHSRRYWEAYSSFVNYTEWKRRSDTPIAHALDACSSFMSGIMLRWILFHKLSPAHGYLHEPTKYTSLVFDLLEPYRYIFEQSVSDAYMKSGDDALIENSISILKDKLDEWVYVPSHKGYVRRKNLLHGAVLALRSYLIGDSKLIVIPYEGKKIGGRPVDAGYFIPGFKKDI